MIRVPDGSWQWHARAALWRGLSSCSMSCRALLILVATDLDLSCRISSSPSCATAQMAST